MSEEVRKALDIIEALATWADVIARPRPDVPWQTVADETLLNAESFLNKHGRNVNLQYPKRKPAIAAALAEGKGEGE